MSDTGTITNDEIAVLNAARTILNGHAKGFPDDHAAVRVLLRAETAEHAIFQFLNNLNTWGKVDMTDAQLHNRPTPVPVPQSLRA